MITGYRLFDADDRVLAWARAAAAVPVDLGPLRHGQTWGVGLEALPNTADGSVDGVPLRGPWDALILAPSLWHRAQVSTVFAGYPGRDPADTDAAYGFRLRRDAAHVDGLLPIGPDRRRYLREPHAFILGIALTSATASPLVVWPGSHRIMQAAFAKALSPHPVSAWPDIDLTEVYQAARRRVFDTCPRLPLLMAQGQSVLLHRHLLHGVAPWGDEAPIPQGRRVAYFRPVSDMSGWLAR